MARRWPTLTRTIDHSSGPPHARELPALGPPLDNLKKVACSTFRCPVPQVTMFDHQAHFRREAINIELIRRVLRALAAPRPAGSAVPTLTDVATRMGLSGPAVEAALSRDGLWHGGALTDKGQRWFVQNETNRVRERWVRVMRWYVRLKTLAKRRPLDRAEPRVLR